ncbi:SDR family NAD(P)-dependent oxidoreductase [Notoacmeibacter sp. MSK16QG-6]|uniref:SDR family NAD(P)-dependent oxidoreductase n=1 Tax=Notoacmeibacter sp. MSK16QG-6 TaxID=2957982 RepID=UPI00209DD6C8|nr:SDR family oxidoreductase [Notoacmeibacter sp. MSK16QG-6]MCP1197961.1 SDR family oxidoreductase [Notoacmeibacter sp. MSK16QG-6]
MTENRDMAGRMAVVTGASSGVGREVARQMAERGCNLWLTYHNDDEPARELQERFAGKVRIEARQLDLTDEEAVRELFGEIGRGEDGLDYLVNNASFWSEDLWDADPKDLKPADLRAVFDVDLVGSFLTIRESIDLMKRKGGGAIVNFSSSDSLRGDPKAFAYNPAQVAVIGLTRSVARRYAPSIRCNAIAPGPIDTGWTERWGLSESEKADVGEKNGLAGRMGRPDEIASLACYLLSDSSQYINGQVIRADGGASIA